MNTVEHVAMAPSHLEQDMSKWELGKIMWGMGTVSESIFVLNIHVGVDMMKEGGTKQGEIIGGLWDGKQTFYR